MPDLRSSILSDRPRSFVFMSQPHPVQAAILGEWGMTVLSTEHDDPDQGLTEFLQRLRNAVS